MPHSYEYLVARSVRARQIPELVEIARTSSPSAAYDKAKALTKSSNLAKQTRFLSMILRDHGKEKFQQSLEHQS